MISSREKINLSQKVSFKDQKIQATTPNPQVFHSQSPSDPYLSNRSRPGRILLQYHQLSSNFPGFTFSKIARFESNIFEKFKSNFYKDLSPLFRASSSRSKETGEDRISLNKIMKNYSPVEKSIRLKTISIQEEKHRGKIKLKRDQIFKSIQIEKKEKLIQKFRKFEIRYNRNVKNMQDSASAKKTWTVFLTVLGNAFMLTKAVAKKRFIKKKAKIYLKWLEGFLKYLVFMKRAAKRVKKKLALDVKNIQKITKNIWFVKFWLAKAREKNRKIVADTIDEILLKVSSFMVINLWKFKIVRIQRLLRKAMAERKILINNLLNHWDYTEHFMAYEKTRTKSKRRKAMLIRTSIPFDIKVSILKQKIKEIVHNHLIRVQNYEIIKKMKKKQKKNKNFELIYSSFEKPKKLDIQMEFTPALFETLIKQGLKEKKKRKEVV